MPIKQLDKQKILMGTELLLENDRYLLERNVNERSITHKLAEYYQDLFKNWNVDCEYNKNLSGTKKIMIDPRVFLDRMADSIEGCKINELAILLLKKEGLTIKDLESLEHELRDGKNVLYNEELDLIYFVLELTNGKKAVKRIFPDIIIHHRGTRDNHIVIEAKKTSNKDKKSRAYDIIKLSVLVDDTQYKYNQGVFIDIPTKKDLKDFKKFKRVPTSNKKVCRIV
jgi:hypothetical protein